MTSLLERTDTKFRSVFEAKDAIYTSSVDFHRVADIVMDQRTSGLTKIDQLTCERQEATDIQIHRPR